MKKKKKKRKTVRGGEVFIRRSSGKLTSGLCGSWVTVPSGPTKLFSIMTVRNQLHSVLSVHRQSRVSSSLKLPEALFSQDVVQSFITNDTVADGPTKSTDLQNSLFNSLDSIYGKTSAQ